MQAYQRTEKPLQVALRVSLIVGVMLCTMRGLTKCYYTQANQEASLLILCSFVLLTLLRVFPEERNTGFSQGAPFDISCSMGLKSKKIPAFFAL